MFKGSLGLDSNGVKASRFDWVRARMRGPAGIAITLYSTLWLASIDTLMLVPISVGRLILIDWAKSANPRRILAHLKKK